jgi:malate dehydrogenase
MSSWFTPRGDLLKVSGEIFKTEGRVIGEVSRADCKIVVVGNPANTNAMIAAAHSRNVQFENFSAMTRLDQNRAVFQLANKQESSAIAN